MKRIGLMLAFCVGLPWLAEAHRMDLDCYVEMQELVIEAWTGQGDAVVEGDVTITAEDGTILATGKTDKQGFFRWQPKAMQNITVSVYAGEGHKKEIAISQDDLTELFAEANPPSPESQTGSSLQTSDESRDHVHGATEVNRGEQSTTSASTGTRRSSKSLSTENAFGMPERVVIGLTFLAALSAAWLAHRNGKKLDALLNRGGDDKNP